MIQWKGTPGDLPLTSDTIVIFFQIFLVFSKYLDFNDHRLYFLEIICKQKKRYENIGIRNISMHFVTFAKLKKELGFYAPKIVGIWQIWHIFTNKWHSRIQGTWVSLILRHNGLKNFAKNYTGGPLLTLFFETLEKKLCKQKTV